MKLRRVFVSLLLGALATGACAPETEQAPTRPVGCIDETQPWTTCADFCEWDQGMCAPDSCDGSTVFYGRVDYCSTSLHSTELGCEDQFVFDSEKVIYYCCCEYD